MIKEAIEIEKCSGNLCAENALDVYDGWNSIF